MLNLCEDQLITNEPNQALEATRMLVTDPAAQAPRQASVRPILVEPYKTLCKILMRKATIKDLIQDLAHMQHCIGTSKLSESKIGAAAWNYLESNEALFRNLVGIVYYGVKGSDRSRIQKEWPAVDSSILIEGFEKIALHILDQIKYWKLGIVSEIHEDDVHMLLRVIRTSEGVLRSEISFYAKLSPLHIK